MQAKDEYKEKDEILSNNTNIVLSAFEKESGITSTGKSTGIIIHNKYKEICLH